MKKIKSLILTSACIALTLTSCDMDKYPYDSIPVENAVESLSDCQNLRNGMYRDLRIISSSFSGFMAQEMQADCLIPTNNYGNQWSNPYLWDMESSDSDATTVWNNNYVTIAQCNLIINGILRLESEGKLASEDLADAKNILGEAYMVRAMCYYDLATKFCNLYDANTAEEVLGIPLPEDMRAAI